VPYWTVFGTQRCATSAREWIKENGQFPRIDVSLFNHGADSVGLADACTWHKLTRAGDTPGTLLGQRPQRFPADFAALTRAGAALRRLPDGPPWSGLSVDALISV